MSKVGDDHIRLKERHWEKRIACRADLRYYDLSPSRRIAKPELVRPMRQSLSYFTTGHAVSRDLIDFLTDKGNFACPLELIIVNPKAPASNSI
jgi:hypothetical protein